ncbi:MAG: hypothetical protein AB1798_19200, partial [Spirochaetota bacterium]
EICFKHAIQRIAGLRDAEDFLVFADNIRYSCLFPADSPKLSRLLEKFRFEYLYGRREESFEIIFKKLKTFVRAAEHLEAGLKNSKLNSELKPWIRKYSAGIKLLQKTFEYLRTKDKIKGKVLKTEYTKYMKDATKVFADVVYPFIGSVINNQFGNPE